MKAAGLSLLCFVAAGILRAEEPVAPATAPAPLSSVIRAGLPAYAPPAPVPVAQPPAPAEAADPNAIELPKVTVRERHQPRINSIDLLTPEALERKFAVDYKKSLTGLDKVLNGFSIPLFGPSLAARGRARYVRQQWEDIGHIMAVGAKAAKSEGSPDLPQAATDAQQAIDWQNRPAGSK